jgi:hypothetical protein
MHHKRRRPKIDGQGVCWVKIVDTIDHSHEIHLTNILGR